MNWPLAQDFSMMLQHPRKAFREATLQAATIEKNALGQPKPRSGNFAAVFRASLPGGEVAVRVFTRPNAERAERYQAISTYLDSRILRSLVRCVYHEGGIRSAGDGKWYPLITMEWVRGETLYDWIRARCMSRDQKALHRLADQWVEVIEELDKHHVAHGDLQHGNIMVTDGGLLKLVDYDGMCVPALAGRRNLETGLPPYQHPGRNDETLLHPHLDSYSALFIMTAVKLLAVNPGLWQGFVDARSAESLLFLADDLREPDQSPLIQQVRHCADSEARDLGNRLLELYRVPLDRVPPFRQLIDAYGKVEQLLSARDWDAAVDLLGRMGPNRPPPLSLHQRLREAQARVQRRLALEKAIQSGDEEEVVRAYDARLLDDYPAAAPAVAIAKQAAKVAPVARELRAATTARDWRRLVVLWDKHAAMFAQWPSTSGIGSVVDRARRQNQLCDELLRLVKVKQPDMAMVGPLWRQLQDLGGHKDVAHLDGALRRWLERDTAWQKWCEANQAVNPGAPQANADRAAVAAWREDLFAGWDVAEPQRPMLLSLKKRLDQLAKVVQLVDPEPDPLTLENEEAFVKAARTIPNDYCPTLQKRLQLAKNRAEAVRKYQQVLAAKVGEAAIAGVWKQITRFQAETLLNKKERQRGLLAGKRLALLEKLQRLNPHLPLDQHDQALRSLWDADLLGSCREAKPFAQAFEQAERRQQALERLRQAIDAKDEGAIWRAAAEPSLAGYPIQDQWSQAIGLALKNLQSVGALAAALEADDAEQFLQFFDLRLIHKHGAALPEELRKRLLKLVRTQLLGFDRCLPGPPTGTARMEAHDGAGSGANDLSFRLRWRWPAPRFTDRCMVAVCRDLPGDSAEDQAPAACLFRMPVDRAAYEGAGGFCVLRADRAWQGCWVVVWAIIDLGMGLPELATTPLELGRLTAHGAVVTGLKRRGWFG